jgi:hypothetical protein
VWQFSGMYLVVTSISDWKCGSFLIFLLVANNSHPVKLEKDLLAIVHS